MGHPPGDIPQMIRLRNRIAGRRGALQRSSVLAGAEHPEHQHVAPSSFQTTERSYIQAQSHVATQRYHDPVNSIRQAAQKNG